MGLERGARASTARCAGESGAVAWRLAGLLGLLIAAPAAAAPVAPVAEVSAGPAPRCFFYIDPSVPQTSACRVTVDDAPAFVRRISAGAAAGDTAAVDAALAAATAGPWAWCNLAADEGGAGEGRARRQAIAHRYVADVTVHALATRRWAVAAACGQESVARAPDDRARAAALHNLARAAPHLDPQARAELAAGTVVQSDNVFVELDPGLDPVDRLSLRAFLADPSHARLARVSARARAGVEEAVAALDAPAAVPLLGPFDDVAGVCRALHADHLARRRAAAGDGHVCTLDAGRAAPQLVTVHRVFAVEDAGEGKIECLAGVYAVVPEGRRWFAAYVGVQSGQSERGDMPAELDQLGGVACNILLSSTFARVEPVRLPAIEGRAGVGARALAGDIARAEGDATLDVRDVVCVDGAVGPPACWEVRRSIRSGSKAPDPNTHALAVGLQRAVMLGRLGLARHQSGAPSPVERRDDLGVLLPPR